MIDWEFSGQSFAWASVPELGLSVDFDWHLPESYMLAANPVFEVEEMRSLISKTLSFNWRQGDADAATSSVSEIAFSRGETFPEVGSDWDHKDFRCSAFVLDDRIEISIFLEERTELDILVNNFKSYGAMHGEKFFRGYWQTQFLFGPLSISVQPDIKRRFLNGELGLLATGLPGLSFISGMDLPSPPDLMDVLARQI